ncbi:MAG TPA: heavy metal translocating P-type ATPase [Pseudolysinimonas sp.]
MPRLLRLLAHYPVATVAVFAGIAAGVLAIAGLAGPLNWVLGILAVSVGVLQLFRMLRDLRGGHWGLDILAVSAIAATVALGELWAAYVVTLMILGGQALADSASARARRQLRALMARAPREAHRMTGDRVADIPVEQVVVGDRLLVKAGEAAPVDGTLLDEGDFDESSLSGESLPVTHLSGDAILSGAVNGGSPVRMVARALARDSQYQRIIAMVDAAGSVRGRFLRLADRLAIPFTALAYVLAATAWIVSGEAVRFAEVLVVATPCPLLVAAPTALVAGMGRSAREGVIVKSGQTLERIAAVRGVAMDKTGTLTYGTPRVDRIEPAEGFDADTLLAVAAAAEQISAHVLADAIVEEAHRRGVELATLEGAQEVTGSGIRASWGDLEVVVGKSSFVDLHTRSGAAAPGDLGAGEMGVRVGIGGRAAGRLVMRDEVRADAAEVVADLRRLGVDQVMMVTGDGADNARRVAADVGITDVRYGMLPADKVAAVSGMTSRPTMMIGDGVNDAPVLAAADVGVAMGARGSTAASESADVVLLVDELGRVPQVIRTSAHTMRIARQSIGIGIGLSIALMIVATFGVIPAIIGALAQEAIDVVTILNGLRAGRDQR